MTSPQTTGLQSLGFSIHYEGVGEKILHEFVVPAISQSNAYDRLTGYFSVGSLLAIAQGLEDLWRRKGTMRLVLGVHDVPKDLLEATLADDEWADKVVAEVRKRLLAQASSLRDEFQRNRLATLAWMLRDGLLQVRVAAPSSPAQIMVASGIFHSKRLIFRDAFGECVSAVGSPNETVPGFSTNYEELTVHMSWGASAEYVKVHAEQFEKIWDGRNTALAVRTLHKEFADELLQRLQQSGKPKHTLLPNVRPSLFSEVVSAARGMRDYSMFSLGQAVLYPHQERVFVDALSRWPVRVMLADEVGLGKTLEAGSVIRYMLRFGNAKRIVVLAPKNVMRQWQEELINHFGLDFWAYSSETKSYVSATGEVRPLRGSSPVGKGSPDLLIVSAQYARGMRGPGHIFTQTTILPDLVVVDEAHAARVRPDIDGRLRPTRLWRLVNALTKKVPHVLLLTATPLQMHWEEYHSLLALIGLPSAMADGPDYRRSLALIASQAPPTLEDAKWVLRWLKGSLAQYELSPEGFEPHLRPLLKLAQEHGDKPGLRERQEVMRDWPLAHEVLVRLHPGQLLTIRNTRTALASLGYRFPERVLHAPTLRVSEDVQSFYHAVGQYLSEGYGLVDQALNPDRRVNLGFAKSSYHQRLASSLYAARISLEKRSRRLEAALNGAALDDADEEESDEVPEFDAEDAVGMSAQQHERLEWAVRIERAHISALLVIIDRLAESRDPKLQTMVEILQEHVPDNQVLVFSRYTDTVEGCLQEFYRTFPPDRLPGHALYTGSEVWIDTGTGRTPANKQEVKRALDQGEIQVVFCSDAASEGLNLQAARAIINVDVPWNPARLEQRIGRIARLGQRAPEVDVYNLWYPDSVEARMYGRLLERKGLYELAVGECPELFSETIRAEIAVRYDAETRASGIDPIIALQDLRRREQHRAMQQVWNFVAEPVPGSTQVRAELKALLLEIATQREWHVEEDEDVVRLSNDGRSYTLTAEPGREGSLSLAHPVWDELRPITRRAFDAPTAALVAIVSERVPITLALRHEDELYPVRAASLPRILRSIAFGTPVDLSALDGSGKPSWTPRHSQMQVVPADSPPPSFTLDTAEVLLLGHLPIIGAAK